MSWNPRSWNCINEILLLTAVRTFPADGFAVIKFGNACGGALGD